MNNRIEKCPVESVNCLQKKRGTINYRTDISSGIIVVRWKDNNVVTIMSNRSGVKPLDSAKR